MMNCSIFILLALRLIYNKEFDNALSKDDAFIIMNVNHGNNPITLFNYANGDSTLPMRLSKLDSESIPYQLFNVRYNFSKDFWLAPEIDTSYGSFDNNRYLIAKRKPFTPNMRLKALVKDKENKTFKMVSGSKCLTVGSNINKKGLEYWQLEFIDCKNNDRNQEFIFIPRLVALSYLDKADNINVTKSDIKRSYETLNRVLKNFNETLDGEVI